MSLFLELLPVTTVVGGVIGVGLGVAKDLVAKCRCKGTMHIQMGSKVEAEPMTPVEAEELLRQLHERGIDVKGQVRTSPPPPPAGSTFESNEARKPPAAKKSAKVTAARTQVNPHWTFVARVAFLVIVLMAALFVILSKQYGDAEQKWAFGIVGLIVGHWLKT